MLCGIVYIYIVLRWKRLIDGAVGLKIDDENEDAFNSYAGLKMEGEGIMGSDGDVLMDGECWINDKGAVRGIQGREGAHFPGQRMDGADSRAMKSRISDQAWTVFAKGGTHLTQRRTYESISNHLTSLYKNQKTKPINITSRQHLLPQI